MIPVPLVADPFWSEADILALKSAILTAGPVLSVSYSGPPARTVTYRSLAEMRSLLDEMVAANADGVTAFRRVQTNRGFRSGGSSRRFRYDE